LHDYGLRQTHQIMKKTALIALLAILCLSVKAQKDTSGLNLPIKDGMLVYEGVVSIDNKSQKDLYTNASQWFVDFFKSSKDVIQNQDKEQGRIVGKGILFAQTKIWGITSQYPNEVTIQIDVKDNKYRYRIYDMHLSTETQYLRGFGTLYGRSFTAEDLIGNLTGGKNKVLTKSASRKTLESINDNVRGITSSLLQAMKVNNSF